MGFEHSSSAGTGRSLRSESTKATKANTSSTADGRGKDRLMRFGPWGCLFIYPEFASPTKSFNPLGLPYLYFGCVGLKRISSMVITI
jgi:hypothetical protein